MTEQQMIEVLAIIKGSFPNFQKDIPAKQTLNVWMMMFNDDDYNLVITAVSLYVASEKFPPTIADIREKMVDVQVETITADEAWGQVKYALGRFGHTNEKAAMEYFHPSVRQLVKRLSWQDLCKSENLMADRAHFIKLWDSNMKHTKEQAMLPQQLKKKLELNYKKNDMNAITGSD